MKKSTKTGGFKTKGLTDTVDFIWGHNSAKKIQKSCHGTLGPKGITLKMENLTLARGIVNPDVTYV